ncbi:MAG: hypothetical protein FJY99_01960 [Candidatus Sericytochromatia bacterium]|nr:hypothetical protein [Candidatus Tanganyikabacteria bacterium]
MFDALKGPGGTGWLTALGRASGSAERAADVTAEPVEVATEAGDATTSDELDLGKTVQDRLTRFLGSKATDTGVKNILAELEDGTGRGNFGVPGRRG